MEPILSKDEIAELLTALKDGTVSMNLDSDQEHKLPANVKELNLFQMASSSDGQLRIPNFDIILDSFAQNFSTSITNQLQRTFRITRTGIDSMTFNDFIVEQKDPGAIGILNLDPLKTGCLIIFSPHLSYTMIEIMLGASSEIDPLDLDRKLTTIELNILKATISKACGDLDRSMAPIAEIESSLLKVENNTRLVSITEPESEVIVGRFTVTIGGQSGDMITVFPVITLEPLRDKLKNLLSVETTTSGLWDDILLEEVQNMSTTIVAQSGTIDLTIAEVMRLQKGDIIPLHYDPNSPLRVLIENKMKFFAIPGVNNGKKAISLTGVSN